MPDDSTPGPGARLRQARLEARISLTELARRLQVTPGRVSNLENDVKRITLDRIDEVCQALGVDPHSIDRRLSPLSMRG